METGFTRGDARALAGAALLGLLLIAIGCVIAGMMEETTWPDGTPVTPPPDAAAYQVSGVLEEARRITIDAAERPA